MRKKISHLIMAGILMLTGLSGIAHGDVLDSLNVGDLKPGQRVTVTFKATVNSSVHPYIDKVSNQGRISGSNFTPVYTDDPDVPGLSNPTETPLSITLPIIELALQSLWPEGSFVVLSVTWDGFCEPNLTLTVDWGDSHEEIIVNPPNHLIPIIHNYTDIGTYTIETTISDGQAVSEAFIDVTISHGIIVKNTSEVVLDKLKEGHNRILINPPCFSYSSYDLLIHAKEICDFPSLNYRDNKRGAVQSTYFFFGKICGEEVELCDDNIPAQENSLYIINIKDNVF